MSRFLRIISLIAVIFNTFYWVWLFFNVTGLIGWLLFLAETIFIWSFNLFAFNHWQQASRNRSYRIPEGSLDIFLPVVNEPIDMFEATLKAAVSVKYAQKTVYVLDDGHRDEVKTLACKYKAKYFARRSNGHYKAGNLNYALKRSKGDFILVLDADQVVRPTIANHLLGFFKADPSLALITTKQR